MNETGNLSFWSLGITQMYAYFLGPKHPIQIRLLRVKNYYIDKFWFQTPLSNICKDICGFNSIFKLQTYSERARNIIILLHAVFLETKIFNHIASEYIQHATYYQFESDVAF